MAKQSSDRADVYTRVTDQIIRAIEAGADDWKMPWHATDVPFAMPVNAATGKRYRGVNVVALWSESHYKGYPEAIWATYRQWEELGKQVSKGQKAAIGVFWKQLDQADRTGDTNEGEQAEETKSRSCLANAFALFNVAQTEGYEAPSLVDRPEVPRIEQAEQFFEQLGANIQHGGNRAYYRPSTDHIQMPPFEAFITPEAYYATLAHEATHWTAHKSRLDRDLSGRFGSESYAAEELIAELGAAFLSADLALSPEMRDDHASYIQSWLKILKADNRAIFTAASHAQKAADFLHGKQIAAEPEPEPERMTPEMSFNF